MFVCVYIYIYTKSEGRGGVLVSTSAQKAGGPWFDSRSGHDRFCVSVSICLYIYIKLFIYIYENGNN